MKYFIVSDVHSYYSILKKTLDEKGFSPNEDHVLMVLGDAFDRGEETREMAEFLLSLHDRGKLIYITGNHEELMIRCLHSLASGADPIDIATSNHARNGTWQSILDLADMSENDALRQPLTLVARVMQTRVYKELFPSCVDCFETDKYIFVHGFVPCLENGYYPYVSYSYNPDWREASYKEWERARWYNGVRIAEEQGIRVPEKTVVCGHWHTSYYHHKYENKGSEWGEDADFSPYVCKNGAAIGIDACTYASRTVNCLVLDSAEM